MNVEQCCSCSVMELSAADPLRPTTMPSTAAVGPPTIAPLQYQTQLADSRRTESTITSRHRPASPVDVTTSSSTTTTVWPRHSAPTASTLSYNNTRATTTTTTTTLSGKTSVVEVTNQTQVSDRLGVDSRTSGRQQTCAACGRPIADRFLLHAIDRYWHTGCLRCTACHIPLADLGSTCFTRAGMTLCRNDYIRLFGVSGICSACRNQIPPNEFVMRTHDNAAVYHVTCFTCVTCRGRLVPGDRYGVVNGCLVCEHDYISAALSIHQHQQPPHPSISSSSLSSTSSTSQPPRQHHDKLRSTIIQ